MGSGLPAFHVVAGDAERPGEVVLDEEFSKTVVMGIMAGGALHLVVLVESNMMGERGGVTKLPILGSEATVIRERNGMVVRQIGANPGAPVRHGRNAALHLDGRHTAVEHAESDGAVVATETKLGSAGGLANGGFDGGTAVGDIGRGRKGMIPQRRLAAALVRGVTKHADLRLVRGADRAEAGSGKIMFRAEDGIAAGGDSEACEKRESGERFQPNGR